MLKDLELERIEKLSDTEAELITGGTLTLPSALLEYYLNRSTTGDTTTIVRRPPIKYTITVW
jgi:hypothetical protein